MKLFCLAGVFVAMLFSPLFAGVEILVNVESDDVAAMESIVVQWEKGNARILMPEESSMLILDGEIYFIDDENKKYFSPTELLAMMGLSDEDASTDDMFNFVKTEWDSFIASAQIKKTGKSQQIAGFSSDEFKVESESEVLTLAYFSKDPRLIRIYDNVKKEFKGEKSSLFFTFLFFTDEYGILLKSVNAEGKTDFEVMSVKEKAFSASMFSLAGYTEMSLEEIMMMFSGPGADYYYGD
jgi:hypothetical protein